MTHPTQSGDGPARAPVDDPLFADPPPAKPVNLPKAPGMTIQEAVRELVRFVEDSPAWDKTAAAARIVLRDFKAQAQVGLRLEALVHQFVKETEEATK